MYFSNKPFRVRFLYNILTHIATTGLKPVAHFNSKLKLGIDGRSQTFKKLNTALSVSDKTMWFHCSSLGEYEQGLPVFEELKKLYPDLKIVLSFFSPSGYEIRKNAPIADVIVYLPFDTASNAKRFIDIIDPQLVIFVKYEIWPNYLDVLKKQNVPTLLISALLRKNHSYFKWYGTFMRNALSSFNHIFTQDLDSKQLLSSINYTKVSVSGDTRFDRVSNQLKIDNTLHFIESFKNNKKCIVVGSSWKEDEAILIPYINGLQNEDVKIIIAPHNIKQNDIDQLKNQITKKTVLYSEMENKNLKEFNVLILDTIGLLSKVYSYADIAYIGGAMGSTGLHNTLEAAVFGIPIIIGKNYSNFPEAKAMIANKGMTSVSNTSELSNTLNQLLEHQDVMTKAGNANKNYIENNKGAVVHIINHIRKYVSINTR